MGRWLVIAVFGCGRIGFDPALLDDTAIDAIEIDSPLGFDVPEPIGPLSDPGEDDDPTLTGDLLELYFVSGRAGGMGGLDIWRSIRTSSSNPWSAPSPVVELNTPGEEDVPGIARDGLTIWFASSRMTGVDIWQSTRTDRASPWSVPTAVTDLSSMTATIGCPEPSETTLRMTLCRNQTTSYTLLESTRSSIGAAWSVPVDIPALNGDSSRSGFFVTDTELWFATNRPSPFGGYDIYRAIRADVTAPFGSVTLIDALASPQDDDDPWLAPDGRVVIFASNRSGDYEIYQATR